MKNYLYILFLITAINSLVAQNQADIWETMNTGYADMSGIISTPSKDTVFIHRIDGSLIRSFNGGLVWDSIFIRHDSIKFTDVGSTFINGKHGFVWGIWGCMYTGILQERTVLLKTTNSGNSWEIAMNGLPLSDIKNISLVHFWDNENGMLVAECGSSHHENHTYTTFNGGDTWIETSVFNPMLNYAPRMVSFVDRYTGIMCGMELNLKFSLTDNGGYDWKNSLVHKLNYSPTGVKLFNDNSGFILANDSVFLTDNNFKYYIRKALPFSNYNNTVLSNNASFYSVDNNTTYFLTFNDGIYKTTDGFTSYSVSKQKNNLPNYSISGFDKEVYVYGLNGLVYKTTVENKKTINTIESEINIYPNPTSSDFVALKSKLTVNGYSISNILGMVIKPYNTIENNEIDLQNLVQGSYIVSLFGVKNELIATKKIIKLTK